MRKTCTKCGQEKEADEFYWDSRANHLGARCKKCVITYMLQHRRDNIDAFKEKDRLYYIRHRDERVAYVRQWRVEHPTYVSDYHKANRAKNTASHREWCHNHPEAIREHLARYQLSHPEQIGLQRARRLARLVPQRLGEVRLFYKWARQEKVITCYLCGKPTRKGERHVDHVMPLARGGLHAPENLTVLCAPCNLRKSVKLPNQVGLLL